MKKITIEELDSPVAIKTLADADTPPSFNPGQNLNHQHVRPNCMNQKLVSLKNRTMRSIETFAKRNDAASISRLAGVASKLEQMQKQLAGMEQETIHIEESLANYERQTAAPLTEPTPTPSETGRRNGRKISIRIDWSRLGKNHLAPEVICEHRASNSLARWATRLFEELGVEIIQKLTQVHIGRGPLVSRNPELDFRNKSDGSIYQHQAIGNSGHYVLTHSETREKVEDIQVACRHLGFPLGSILVEEVAKNDFAFGGGLDWTTPKMPPLLSSLTR